VLAAWLSGALLSGSVLRFRTVGGELVEACVVHHPGYRGHHIVARALHEAWLAFPALARPSSEAWGGADAPCVALRCGSATRSSELCQRDGDGSVVPRARGSLIRSD